MRSGARTAPAGEDEVPFAQGDEVVLVDGGGGYVAHGWVAVGGSERTVIGVLYGPGGRVDEAAGAERLRDGKPGRRYAVPASRLRAAKVFHGARSPFCAMWGGPAVFAEDCVRPGGHGIYRHGPCGGRVTYSSACGHYHHGEPGQLCLTSSQDQEGTDARRN